MNPVMYIFVNAAAKMSQGKLGSQTAHAALDAYAESKQEMIEAWYIGHHTAKVVLHADDAQHLLSIERYINDRGFATSLVIDEGRTEVDAFRPTALGVEIVDKDDPHTKATFGSFQLLKDPKPEIKYIECEPVTYFEEDAKPETSLATEPGVDWSKLVVFGKDLLLDENMDLDTLLRLRKQFVK